MRHFAHTTGILLPWLSMLCFAGQKHENATLTLRALAYRAIPHERTMHYRTSGHSNTSCYGSGTDWGYSTTINLNCSTVTTPPQDIPVTVRSVEVYNKLEAEGMVYIVTCTAHWIGSNCTWLIPGDSFPAEVKGTTMWITAHKGGNMGKEVHPKFRILDIRPAPVVQSSGQLSKTATQESVSFQPQAKSPLESATSTTPSARQEPASLEQQISVPTPAPVQTATSEVVVTSVPTGAEVFCNNVFMGVTPVTLRFPGQTPGLPFTVTVGKAGYQSWMTQSVIVPGRTSLHADLLVVPPAPPH